MKEENESRPAGSCQGLLSSVGRGRRYVTPAGGVFPWLHSTPAGRELASTSPITPVLPLRAPQEMRGQIKRTPGWEKDPGLPSVAHPSVNILGRPLSLGVHPPVVASPPGTTDLGPNNSLSWKTVPGRKFNSLSGHYPLDASSTIPLQLRPKMSADITQCPLGGKTVPS